MLIVNELKPTPLNRDLSALAQSIQPPTPKECYGNSIKLMGYKVEQITGASLNDIYYVEGYTVVPFLSGFNLPIEHGWLEVEGEVIETTLNLTGAAAELSATSTLRPLAYFPAYRLTMREVLEAIGRNGNRLPLWHYFRVYGAHNSPEAIGYRSAVYSSNLHAYGEELAAALLKTWQHNSRSVEGVGLGLADNEDE